MTDLTIQQMETKMKHLIDANIALTRHNVYLQDELDIKDEAIHLKNKYINNLQDEVWRCSGNIDLDI